jgi:D-alanyl-lipoteichoic acid acyltransferase DltB (MBOAT superfamily)
MRFYALIDGINTWENMGFCIMEAYTFEIFWRNWHKSFN